LAPEFILPKKRVIKLKLDIYSLGVTIVEILTGRKEDFAIEDVRTIYLACPNHTTIMIYNYVSLNNVVYCHTIIKYATSFLVSVNGM
jgi:serine/threonine protein kinase